MGGKLEKGRSLPHGVVKGELEASIFVAGAARRERTIGGVALRWGLKHKVASGVEDAFGVCAAPKANL